MGLITKTLEIKVSKRLYKHFESLGYDIPKRIDDNGQLVPDFDKTMIINVCDLTKQSKMKVDVACEICGKVSSIAYGIYMYQMEKHGQHLCNKCANREYHSGEKNINWNPDKTDEERKRERGYQEYYDFIRKVLARDHDTCICCGKRDKGHMNVHHLNGYSWFVEGRCDETNGVTLCPNCHQNFHAKYGFKNNTKEQFFEWLGINQLELEKFNGITTPAKRVYCYEEDIVYDSVKMAQIAHGYKDRAGIYKVCNHIKKYNTSYGKHWFWYDEYINMTEDEIQYYINK